MHIVILINCNLRQCFLDSTAVSALCSAAQVRSPSHCVHSVTNKTQTGELFCAFFAFRPDICKLFLSFICPLIPPFTLGTFKCIIGTRTPGLGHFPLPHCTLLAPLFRLSEHFFCHVVPHILFMRIDPLESDVSD